MYCPTNCFGDGVCRLRPTLIFRDKGLRISKEEKSNWDKRVKVFFQEKAWCDQTTMKCWINEEWGHMFFNPATPESSGKILCADVHRAQQTATVKRMLQSKNTVLVNILPGCTSKVQPLDVSININPSKITCGHNSENTAMKTLNFTLVTS